MVHGTEWSLFGMHFVWWFIWIAIVLVAFTTPRVRCPSRNTSGEGWCWNGTSPTA